MKVKFLKNAALNTRLHNKGSEAEVSDDHAKVLINRGLAKPAEPDAKSAKKPQPSAS